MYGIVPAERTPPVDSARVDGIDGALVVTIGEGPLAAACSVLPESEYGEAVLNERVRDLDWLTPRAAAHHAVNARLLELAGSVLPLSFGALYRDEVRVQAMLREDVARRLAALAQLAGRAEWVVTVTREGEPKLAREDLERLDHAIAESPPGRAFLLGKRRASVALTAGQRADAAIAEHALRALTSIGERTYREPVAAGDTVVVRVSLLARRADEATVAAGIDALRDELAALGYGVRSTGPWPAYRFGSLL